MARRVLTPLMLVIAIVLSACGGGSGDAQSDVLAAFKATASEDFAFEVTLELDNAAIASSSAAESLSGLGLFAGGLSIRGVHTSDGSSFAINVMGTSALEVRSFDGGKRIYLKSEAADLLATFGGVSIDDMIADARAQGVPEEFAGLIAEGLSGNWVGAEVDPQAYEVPDLEDLGDLEGMFEELREEFSDIEGILTDYAVLESIGSEDGEDLYAAEIRFRDLLGELMGIVTDLMQAGLEGAFGDLGEPVMSPEEMQAEMAEGLADAPELLGGFTIGITDGHVSSVRLDVGAAAASLGDPEMDLGLPEGAFVIEFTLTRDGVAPVEEPDAKTFLDAEAFRRLMESAAMAGQI